VVSEAEYWMMVKLANGQLGNDPCREQFGQRSDVNDLVSLSSSGEETDETKTREKDSTHKQTQESYEESSISDYLCLTGSDEDAAAASDESRKGRKSFMTSQNKSPGGGFVNAYKDQLSLALLELFGFENFRPGQRAIIERVLDGQNTLAVMPTGSGKSLAFLVPAALLPGLVIVVSPLLSLMEDQVRKLPAPLPGGALTSTLSAPQAADLSDAVACGRIKILFVSPERFTSLSFARLMETLRKTSPLFNPLSLVCVDEAHCLSQWSYNFRPAFLRIRRSIIQLKPQSVLALTATASPSVRCDIAENLGIAESNFVTTPMERTNLSFFAIEVDCYDKKRASLLKIIKEDDNFNMKKVSNNRTDGALCIVYVSKRTEAEVISDFLRCQVTHFSNAFNTVILKISEGFSCRCLSCWY
jgi:replicative superfamily II helicase